MAKKKETFKIETVDVTRSYSRKLNMSAYGGKQYETADLHSSRTAKDVPMSEAKIVGLELHALCVAEVDAVIKQVEDASNEVESAVVPKPAKKKKSTMDLGLEIEKEEIEAISTLINDLTLAKTQAELKKAAVSIRKQKDSLNETQQEYLSLYFKKRLAAVSK